MGYYFREHMNFLSAIEFISLYSKATVAILLINAAITVKVLRFAKSKLRLMSIKEVSIH